MYLGVILLNNLPNPVSSSENLCHENNISTIDVVNQVRFTTNAHARIAKSDTPESGKNHEACDRKGSHLVQLTLRSAAGRSGAALAQRSHN